MKSILNLGVGSRVKGSVKRMGVATPVAGSATRLGADNVQTAEGGEGRAGQNGGKFRM